MLQPMGASSGGQSVEATMLLPMGASNGGRSVEVRCCYRQVPPTEAMDH